MNSSVLCRICAKPQTQNFQNLFDIKHAKILKQFQKLTGKSLICEENLPQHICQYCLENLARAYDFRAKLLAVQHYYTTSRYLNTLLTKRNLDKRKEKTKRIENKNEDEQNIKISKTITAEEAVELPVEECHVVIVDEFQTSEDELTRMEKSKSPTNEGHIAIVDELQDLENEFQKMDEGKSTTIKGICQYCGKICKYSGELGRHLRRHEGIKRFQCELCVYKSYTRIDMELHRTTHTGERPFPCNYCEKRFPKKQALKVHTRIHENVRPYICRYCNKGFSQNTILKTHMVSHGESRFNCLTCVRPFQSKASLLKHYDSSGHLQNLQPQESILD